MHPKVKKCFLQACMNHGSLESSKIEQILHPICEKYNETAPQTSADLQMLIVELNEELNNYNQSLVFVKHSIVNQEFLVFAVTLESEISKRQAHLTDADRYYFTKLLEAIVEEENYCISAGDVFGVLHDPNITTSQRQQMHKSHMRDLLQLWTDQGYLLQYENDFYFGPRILVEFAGYLKKHYPNNVQDCALCSKLVLWDVACSHCQRKVHRSCIRHYLIKNSNCPVCKKVWNTRLSA